MRTKTIISQPGGHEIIIERYYQEFKARERERERERERKRETIIA